MEDYITYNSSLKEENEEELIKKMKLDNEKRNKQLMIWNLVNQTGVEKIRIAFELPYDEHDEIINIIMSYILKKCDFTNSRISPYLFLVREIGFSPEFLSICGADDPRFFEHSTLEEICESLLIRSLVNFGYELSLGSDQNRFPHKFSFDGNVNKFLERDGILMYPFYTSRAFNLNKIMENIYSLLSSQDSRNNLYFHGTNWMGALSITEDILRNARYTDFGNRCFYVSDYLITAARWAINRNTQPAIVVFNMDDNWINNIRDDRKRTFLHNDRNSLLEWKHFVFNSRQGQNNNYHYINGPIMANSRRPISPEEIEYLHTDNVIPYQTAIRTNYLCEEFRTNILCIIFFREGSTLEDNGL